jgi:hypothetical protein
MHPPVPARMPEGRMNKLLIVSIDTYRRDNIGKIVKGRPISPFLTTAARQNTFHNNYYASANWTIPSYASMFTGLPTIGHNFWGVKSIPEEPAELIFDTLTNAGMRSSLLCAGVLGEADIFKYRSSRYYASTYDPFKLDGTIDLIVERLRESDFVFFHTFLMHDYMMAYAYGSPVRGLRRTYPFISESESVEMSEKMKAWRREHFSLTKDDLERLERMYYNECILVDAFVQALFDEVRGRFAGLDIIVNSDHGECFSHCGKHAFGDDWEWILWPLWHHSSGLCFEQFEVFAIDCRDTQNGGAVDGDLMDHEDIHRMILERFGLPAPPRSPKTGVAVSTGYDKFGFCGVLEDDEIYLFDLSRDLAFVLNDHLRKTAPVPPDRHRIVSSREMLSRMRKQSTSSRQVSDEVRTRLRGFGYM